MYNNATLDDMIIQYSENPFVDEPGFKPVITNDQARKVSILNRLLYMANLLGENKMEEMRQTFRAIQSSVLPIKPAISQTRRPGIVVENNSACATR